LLFYHAAVINRQLQCGEFHKTLVSSLASSE
jgi:hypothetical protein